MKNKSLLSLVVFSSLIIPTIVSAGITNDKVELKGILSIKGHDSIELSKHAGETIRLNKGYVEITTEKAGSGLSLFAPEITIKQNGQSLSIKVPRKNFQTDEEFNLSARASELNYNLSLEKTETKSAEVVKTEIEACQYMAVGSTGAPIRRSGVKKVSNTYVTTTEAYKLTLSEGKTAAAVFKSKAEHKAKVNSSLLEICK